MLEAGGGGLLLCSLRPSDSPPLNTQLMRGAIGNFCAKQQEFMISQLVKFFVVFLVVVEPVSLIPVFAGLTQGATAAYKKRMARKASCIALGICVVFATAGAKFLEIMGIELSSFRLAGGTLLFLISLEMVFARPSGTRSTSKEDEENKRREDISVFPLAFPFMAGPGALATILLGSGEAWGKPVLFAGFLLAVTLVMAICWVAMRATPKLMRALGVTGANVINRLSGVILAALAVQFIVDGIRGSLLS
jgi:multiple antibiotic resistance protein